MLNRKQNESALDHHRRLIYGKLVDKTFADVDYSELSSYVYGQEYSSDVARRMMYGSNRTLQLMEQDAERSIAGDDLLREIDLKRIELQKERQRFYDQRVAFNKLFR